MADPAESVIDTHIRAADEEFVKLFIDVTMSFGLPAAPGRIMAELFLAERPLSMQELSGRTGYSLPTLSRNVRAMDGMGVARRETKPGSKKVYVSIRSKQLHEILMSIIKIGYEREVKVMLEHLPRIRQEYEAAARMADDVGASTEVNQALEERRKLITGLENDYHLMERLMGLLGRFILKLETDQEE